MLNSFINSINWQNVWTTSLDFVPDLIQIFILYLVIYALLRAARGSRVGQVLMGVGILFGALCTFTFVFDFDVLQKILNGLLVYLALSTVVIFQPEIRRLLATIGSLFAEDKRKTHGMQSRISPDYIVDIAFMLGQRKMGALIAFERAISLRGIEMTGVSLDAKISPELLVSIFTPPLPLHDGGVIVRAGRLAAAHCLFPVSNNTEDFSSTGMRHRSAAGLTEETDALVLVVSEETGLVTISHNGRLIRFPDLSNESRKSVLRWVRKAMPQQKTSGEVFADWISRRRSSITDIKKKGARK